MTVRDVEIGPLTNALSASETYSEDTDHANDTYPIWTAPARH